MTLQSAHVLCLHSEASTALKQAVFLAGHLGATLHLMPLPETPGRWLDEGELRSEIDQIRAHASDRPPVQIPELSDPDLSAILQYVSDKHIDLVVTDVPSEDPSDSLLSSSPIRTLLQHIDRPVFVTGQVEPAALRRILVPTDLSNHSLNALRHAAGIGQFYDASVEILHVIESIPYVALTPVDRLSLGPMSLSEHRGRRQLQSFLQSGNLSDVPIRSHIAHGTAAGQICHYAARKNVDLLVLSSHGQRGHSDQPFGHVTEQILDQMTGPLLLLPAMDSSLLLQPSDDQSQDHHV